jgi:GDP-L-fucose synthase
MNKSDKIFVAGHNGLVGSAIKRELEKQDYSNILTATRSELDLLNENLVFEFFQKEKPDYVIIAAAKVGGILANSQFPVDFLYQNLKIELNLIEASHRSDVKKVLFLGSSCIYPKMSPQPIVEEYLLTSPLEPTNEPYAIAKIAGIKLCQAYNKQYNKTKFISAMPTNLFGINDNFDLNSSHVLPAMIRKFHEAKINNYPSVTLWGTGTPKREFLFVDDLANACVFLMNNYEEDMWLNVGTGEDVSIKELAEKIKDTVGFNGEIVWDTSKPDGTPRKLLNIDKIKNLGWTPKTSLEEGIKITYEWYLSNQENGAIRK